MVWCRKDRCTVSPHVLRSRWTQHERPFAFSIAVALVCRLAGTDYGGLALTCLQLVQRARVPSSAVPAGLVGRKCLPKGRLPAPLPALMKRAQVPMRNAGQGAPVKAKHGVSPVRDWVRTKGGLNRSRNRATAGNGGGAMRFAAGETRMEGVPGAVPATAKGCVCRWYC